MSMSRLEEVKNLIEQLTPVEQKALLDYLHPRFAQSQAGIPAQPSPQAMDAAWQEFFQIGEALAATDNPESDTLTQTLLEMRR